jgi:hypothetical protein
LLGVGAVGVIPEGIAKPPELVGALAVAVAVAGGAVEVAVDGSENDGVVDGADVGAVAF